MKFCELDWIVSLLGKSSIYIISFLSNMVIQKHIEC